MFPQNHLPRCLLPETNPARYWPYTCLQGGTRPPNRNASLPSHRERRTPIRLPLGAAYPPISRKLQRRTRTPGQPDDSPDLRYCCPALPDAASTHLESNATRLTDRRAVQAVPWAYKPTNQPPACSHPLFPYPAEVPFSVLLSSASAPPVRLHPS